MKENDIKTVSDNVTPSLDTDPYVRLSDKYICESLESKTDNQPVGKEQLIKLLSNCIEGAAQEIEWCKDALKDNVQLPRKNLVDSYCVVKRLHYWSGVKHGYEVVLNTLNKGE